MIALEPHMWIMRYSPVSLKCLFTGVPKPDVSWHKDGKVFHGQEMNAENITGTYESVLKIYRAQYEDSGKFTCKAQNAFGADKDDVLLTVKGQQ